MSTYRFGLTGWSLVDKSQQYHKRQFKGEGAKVNSYKNKACFCELFVTTQLKSLY